MQDRGNSSKVELRVSRPDQDGGGLVGKFVRNNDAGCTCRAKLAPFEKRKVPWLSGGKSRYAQDLDIRSTDNVGAEKFGDLSSFHWSNLIVFARIVRLANV